MCLLRVSAAKRKASSEIRKVFSGEAEGFFRNSLTFSEKFTGLRLRIFRVCVYALPRFGFSAIRNQRRKCFRSSASILKTRTICCMCYTLLAPWLLTAKHNHYICLSNLVPRLLPSFLSHTVCWGGAWERGYV